MSIPLDKLLQSQGFGSRKQCQNLIKSGVVYINHQECDDIKYKIEQQKLSNFKFTINNQSYQYYEKVYIALYKPKYYECSHRPNHHQSIFTLFPDYLRQRGIQCVGRLDQDTTGLLLFTDDGQFLHNMTHPRQHVAKRYKITVEREINQDDIKKLQQGVYLHHEQGLFCADDIHLLSEYSLEFSIYQGVYHQVKRMLASIGHHVIDLHRTEIGDLKLSEMNLKIGEWCYLNEIQLEYLLSK